MVVNIYNKIQKKLPFNKKELNNIITKAAFFLKLKKAMEITVLVVNDREIKKLNQKYRCKNKVTDVLSFGFLEGEKIILPPEEKKYLGDIIIDYNQVKRQAKESQIPFKKEFSLLLVHGFLHLLGYEDETDSGSLKMEKIQNNILKQINV